MEIVKKKITELHGAKYNPRKDLKPTDTEYEKLKRSIEEFGYVEPVIWNKRTNTVVGGHQRLKVLAELGEKEIDCVVVDIDSNKEKALNIALNKISGEWDEIKLEEVFKDLDEQEFDLTLTGFDNEEFEQFLKGEEKEITEDDFDEEPPEEPITKYGDIIILGKHRLMCGDSTKAEDVEKLMDGQKADIAFTSPPYNAGKTIELRHEKNSKYSDDDDNKTEQEYLCFLNRFLTNSLKHSQYSFVNVQSISNNKIALIDFLYENKKAYADTIIWDKSGVQPAMANNVLNSAFEYIHVFSHKGNRAIGTIAFRGTLSNVLHLPIQRNNEFAKIHNATFSVDFASYFVKNFAKNSVLDLFGGTGTTLITCEQLDRICYTMELSPQYCDVIVKRWENLTGEKAVRL